MSIVFLIMATLANPTLDPCRDDGGNDRCSAVKQAEMRALYRVPPIDSYAGATVRRIFFVDGYGNDTVAIEFIRAAAKDPIVRVHFPRERGNELIAPIEHDLSAAQWQEVIAASANFDRQFAKEAPRPIRSKGKNAKDEDGEDIVLCLHSWVYWAEAIDRQGKVRSAVNDACNDAPVEQFAWVAARLAIGAFPYCNAIDPDLSRNDATRMRNCSRLTGDRLTAAAVFNDSEAFHAVDRTGQGGLERLIAYDFELDFQGSKTKTREAEAFWRALMSQERAPNFYYRRIHGLNASEAIVQGELLQETSDEKYQVANVEMRWKDEGGNFRLKSMSVGPYRPLTLPSE